jgi:hypothetical protein
MDQQTTQLLKQIARADEGKALLDDFTVYAEHRTAIKHGYADQAAFISAARRIYAARAAVAEQFGINPTELLDL